MNSNISDPILSDNIRYGIQVHPKYSKTSSFAVGRKIKKQYSLRAEFPTQHAEFQEISGIPAEPKNGLPADLSSLTERELDLYTLGRQVITYVVATSDITIDSGFSIFEVTRTKPRHVEVVLDAQAVKNGIIDPAVFAQAVQEVRVALGN